MVSNPPGSPDNGTCPNTYTNLTAIFYVHNTSSPKHPSRGKIISCDLLYPPTSNWGEGRHPPKMRKNVKYQLNHHQ